MPEGQRLILKDGTRLENGRAGYADGSLWCYIPGYTMQQAASLFFDASKTDQITFQYGEMADVYNGFTNCTNISTDTDGLVSVCMKKGVQ